MKDVRKEQKKLRFGNNDAKSLSIKLENFFLIKNI